jgi:predicted DNA-binding protein with PD1-like motif
MEYRRYADRIAVRLDPGEELITEILAVFQAEHLASAEVRGLGAVSECTLGLYDLEAHVFLPTEFHEAGEIVSLIGTVTRKDGQPYPHLHMAIGRRDCSTVGGHLIRAVISATAEIMIEPIDGTIERRQNPATGINEMKFQA